MPTSGSDCPASLTSKQDTASFSDKIASTKQRFSSQTPACPSFRIYYYDGAAGSIPFEWESHPGTPKHKHASSELPPLPLTPPPCHLSFSNDQIRRGSKKPSKKILALIHTRLLWLSSSGGHKNNKKVMKLSASSPLIDENEYHLFKCQTKGNVMRRFSSFDSAIDHYPIHRSQSTSCFGTRGCFMWGKDVGFVELEETVASMKDLSVASKVQTIPRHYKEPPTKKHSDLQTTCTEEHTASAAAAAEPAPPPLRLMVPPPLL